MKILMSGSPVLLANELAKYARTATVEAEYGDVVVNGSIITLAHHGSRSKNPAPCLRANEVVELDVIGVSHLDLDCLGGVLSLLGKKPKADGFWEMAGEIDVVGAHKATQMAGWEKRGALFQAYWAWSSERRLMSQGGISAEAKNSVVDVTEEVMTALDTLIYVFDGHAGLLEAGKIWAAREAGKAAAAFVDMTDGVAVYVAPEFANLWYDTPEGRALGIVSFQTKSGAIIVSLDEPIPGVSCKEIVQKLWGLEAGGRDGIAGSPRDRRRMTVQELANAALVLRNAIKGVKS
jgi:hypothetical protein